MSHIRGKNTRPELIVRKYLFAHGFRFRVNVKKLPGTPDIVLRKYHTVIFVNGCFWHGHEGCPYFVLPKSNVEFWNNKITRNRERDLKNRIKLRDMGWHVIQLWECQLKPKVREQNLEGLVYTLNKMMLLNYQVKLYDTAPEPAKIYRLRQKKQRIILSRPSRIENYLLCFLIRCETFLISP